MQKTMDIARRNAGKNGIDISNPEPTIARAMVSEVSESRNGRILQRARIWK